MTWAIIEGHYTERMFGCSPERRRFDHGRARQSHFDAGKMIEALVHSHHSVTLLVVVIVLSIAISVASEMAIVAISHAYRCPQVRGDK